MNQFFNHLGTFENLNIKNLIEIENYKLKICFIFYLLFFIYYFFIIYIRLERGGNIDAAINVLVDFQQRNQQARGSGNRIV